MTPLRRSLRLFARFSPALSAASLACAAYAPVSVFVPDAGLGMVSEYASVAPKWDAQNAAVAVPASTTNETNLVWTFWGHTRFDPADWPSGASARVSVTVVAESSVTVRASSFVRAGNWSAPAATAAPVKLSAGLPVTLLVPLPASPSEPVEILRVLLVADEPVPALTITEWSVGHDSAPAASAR